MGNCYICDEIEPDNGICMCGVEVPLCAECDIALWTEILGCEEYKQWRILDYMVMWAQRNGTEEQMRNHSHDYCDVQNRMHLKLLQTIKELRKKADH